jgi:hypothetical protein
MWRRVWPAFLGFIWIIFFLGVPLLFETGLNPDFLPEEAKFSALTQTFVLSA